MLSQNQQHAQKNISFVVLIVSLLCLFYGVYTLINAILTINL